MLAKAAGSFQIKVRVKPGGTKYMNILVAHTVKHVEGQHQCSDGPSDTPNAQIFKEV